MKEVEQLNVIERLAEPTPDKSKKIGRVASVIATVVGGVLTLGVVTAPLGIGILAGVGAISTGVAVYHGQKVDPKGGKVNFLAELFKILTKK